MKRACIAIVDAAQARIYTYDEAYDEEVDLVNPARRGRDPFSMRQGIEHPAGGERSTGDHHAAQPDKLERTFARQVIEELNRIAEQRGLAHVVVVATPEMLGELRTLDAALQRPDLVLEYIERDLARLTSPQAHGHLAQPRPFATHPRPAPRPPLSDARASERHGTSGLVSSRTWPGRPPARVLLVRLL
jgi:protein required for attachment to host cells